MTNAARYNSPILINDLQKSIDTLVACQGSLGVATLMAKLENVYGGKL